MAVPPLNHRNGSASLCRWIGVGLEILVTGCLSSVLAQESGSGPGHEWESLQVASSGSVGFRVREETGIDFVNHLDEKSAEGNRILENGSGVAAGDVDGDGWVDLYFCRLEGANALFRNLGGFCFEEVTGQSGVACADQASTGAGLVDVDGDGDLDLLVSGIGSGVRCFLNDSRGVFSERMDAGLNRIEGSMSMSLADADGDGDLDLYVANYQSITWKDLPPGVKPRVSRVGGKPVAAPADRFVASLRKNGTTAITEIGRPDGFYLNDGSGGFERVDWTGGRFLDEEGAVLDAPPRHWGLSVAFRDFNGDGLPDLYVCNDFLYGNDDFFLNQGEGVFQRVDRGAVRHSSWSAMAVDVSDINRDGHDDFLVVDMLSQDLSRRLTQRANHETGAALRKVGMIFDRPQTQHNTLYLNRGDGSYAEIAHLAGLEASEWSWSLAFLDVDLDGYEDVLIGNGHAHDLLDGDVTMDAMHAMRSAPRGQVPRTLLMYPRLDLPDLAFRNQGDLTFEDRSREWGFNLEGVSSALCRADLDRDGDWDVVLNRLQSSARVLENVGSAPRIFVSLEGRAPNSRGAGARIKLVPVSGTKLPSQEQELVVGGRYLSSDQSALVFAGGGSSSRHRLEVRWRSGTVSVVESVQPNRSYRIREPEPGSGGVLEEAEERGPRAWFSEARSLLEHRHHDRLFDDRLRQPLLPRLMSQLGPGIQWADVNDDGFDDLLVPIDVDAGATVYLNRGGKRFERADSPGPGGESAGGVWMEQGKEEFRYWVGQSNYERGLRSQPSVRAFGFDGSALTPQGNLPGQLDSVGPVVSLDYDGDGDLDLFVGGRVRPGRYPEPAISRLYRNEGGRLKLDLEGSRGFVGLGMVSGAVAGDLDGDSDPELVLALEWGGIEVWVNHEGAFRNETRALGLSAFRGWWNSVALGDFDEDGRFDVIAGNWGRNTRYERYRDEGIRMRYGDLDRNGSVEAFELVYDRDRERWGSIRDLIVMGTAVPALQRRTHSYREFAEMGMEAALGSAFDALPTLEVNWLESSLFLNRGDSFEVRALPVEAQLAPVFGIVVVDFDGDGHEDVFLAQNFFATQPETSRYDAGLGQVLRGLGDGAFESIPAAVSGVRIFGEQRGAAGADYDRDGRWDLAVAQNGGTTHLYRNRGAVPSHRIELRGLAGNRAAIGATLRGTTAGSEGPRRGVFGGGGYWSQDSPVIPWPVSSGEVELEVAWPDGETSGHVLSGEARTWTFSHPDRLPGAP